MPLEEKGSAVDSKMTSENERCERSVRCWGQKDRAVTWIRLSLLSLSNHLLDPPGKHADDLFWGKVGVQGRVWFLGRELAGRGIRFYILGSRTEGQNETEPAEE